MREGMGLYKAKRKDTGKWIQGYLFCIWEKAYILWGTTNGIPNMVEVDPETICEGTGLVDANGVKIFEGDILKPNFDEKGLCFVKFNKGAYGLKYMATYATFYDYYGSDARFEVIGNIHDKAVKE